MRLSILFILFQTAYLSSFGTATDNEKKVERTIRQFFKAESEQNIVALDSLLDKEFRIVSNKQFGSDELYVLSKEDYLNMVKSGKFGGSDLKVKIRNIQLLEIAASAILNIEGKNTSLNSLISLVEDKRGNWKIISDFPQFLENN